MKQLEGRVAVVTGSGRGLGREHALLFAAEGARVVVNDVGSGPDGMGADGTPAQQVVDEIVANGGEAVANTDDVTDWNGAKHLVDQAVGTFGDLHILVNNAGILRDRMIVTMTESEWDSVIAVHLRGHFCPLRHAAAYWRDQSKAGKTVDAAVVHTTSTSGLFANVGQANYGTAKSGIATLSQIASKELARYGVRSNAIAPAARTRLTESLPGFGQQDQAPGHSVVLDKWHRSSHTWQVRPAPSQARPSSSLEGSCSVCAPGTQQNPSNRMSAGQSKS